MLPTGLLYSLSNHCFIWNKMVFELNLYELVHKTYDLFSKDLQKYMKDVSTMVTDWPDNYVRVYPIEF